jgi:hypothetical protein
VLFTGNFFVPLFAMLAIAATTFWVLAVYLLTGAKFDAFAAILSVMTIGLAVDYAVHLAHFYNEHPGKRYAKVQAAIHEVGQSVLNGALTTLGAGLPLLACKFNLLCIERAAEPPFPLSKLPPPRREGRPRSFDAIGSLRCAIDCATAIMLPTF